jgi:predicted TIM-barrel fold metal-dependent hydrolase
MASAARTMIEQWWVSAFPRPVIFLFVVGSNLPGVGLRDFLDPRSASRQPKGGFRMIDAHLHLWALDPQRYPWQQILAHVAIPSESATVAELIPLMDAAGVDYAIAVQPSVYGWDNSYLCDCLDRHPDRLIGVCLVDPRAADAAAKLRYWCAGRGCRGLRINTIGQSDADWLLLPAMEALWAETVRLGVPLCIQINAAHTGAVGRLAERQPALTIIIDYFGDEAFRLGAAADFLGAVATHDNILCKVLLVAQDSQEPWPFQDLVPFYRQVVDAFGATRLMYGAEFPYVRAYTSYARAMRWLDAWRFLSDDQRDAILDRTARRIWPQPGASA